VAGSGESVVVEVSGILGRQIRDTLDRHPALVERLRARGGAIVVVETRIRHEPGDLDALIERELHAASPHAAHVAWPIFVAELYLSDLVERRTRVEDWDRVDPFRIHLPRGVFGGVLAIGEGGLAYARPDGRITGTPGALEELHRLLET